MLYRGREICRSTDCVVLLEERHQPTIYFPMSAINTKQLAQSSKVTFCPFKGNASYFHLIGDDCCQLDAMWGYQTPLDEVRDIGGFVSFDENIEGVEVIKPKNFLSHYSLKRAPYPNPVIEWLLQNIGKPPSSQSFINSFFQCYRQHIDPDVIFFNLVIGTLHPQLTGYRYSWRLGDESVRMFPVSREVLRSKAFLNSPVKVVLDGKGGIRQKIQPLGEPQSYPILEELAELNGTDYVALPMNFSDGQTNFISTATKQARGFRSEQLGALYEAMTLVARVLEVDNLHTRTHILLSTYLGHESCKRVLSGSIHRDAYECIEAVILYSDLRNSTQASSEKKPQDYLRYLNQYMELVADPIIEHGGEVLRFIGDAIVSIFPYGFNRKFRTAEMAMQAALASSTKATVQTESRNQKHIDPIAFGIGIHVGEILYGNCGTPDRLEFTVIGEPVNVAARIEDQCKVHDQKVLISAEAAALAPGQLKSLGMVELKGVARQREVFTLEVDASGQAA